MHAPRPVALLARLLLVAFLSSGAVTVAFAQSDADFLAAKAAFDRGDWRRLDALAPALTGHVLEPYVRYWQLKLGIDAAEPETVRAFLAKYRGTPFAEQLRVDWLKSLATRGLWALFGEEREGAASDDVELACHVVQYRRQREGDVALAAAKPLWFTGRATPDACEPLFAALISKGELSVDDRRARLRLASESGNPRVVYGVAATLPPTDRLADRDFARVDRDPLAALAKGEFLWKQVGGRELALYALERAARRDAVAARAAWVKWRVQMPLADRQYGNGRLALHAARQHAPDAHVYFREAAETSLSEEQHAWRVRAALRAQSWSDVRAAIEAMPPVLASDAAWRYWRARALTAEARHDDAKALYEALAKEFGFYGLLAAESLGIAFEPASQPLATRDDALAAFGARPEVRRAVKLAELDQRVDSLREWAPVIRGLDDEGLLTAADYARRAGLFDRAINTAERTAVRHDFGLRYLMPYRTEFEAAAREHDVDSALLFAIARQESRFVRDIVSSAGASGLMQLMPATARWVAKQLGQNGYRPSQIADVDTNTRYGAFYFRYWLERLDGHPALAAAAYNAGPGRAQAWRPAAALEGAAWVETIPFNETRDYVKKVLANAMFYTRALGKPAVPLSTRLGMVTPRAANHGSVTAAN